MQSNSRKKLAHSIAAPETGFARLGPDPLKLLVAEFAQIHGLSGREGEVCLLLSRGLSEKMIGDALALGAHTAEVYLRRAYQKVGVNSRSDLRHAILNFAADSWHEARTRPLDLNASLPEQTSDV